MAKVINTYTETVTHGDQKLEITINIYDEPCFKNDLEDFYTHIEISKHGKTWGRLFLPLPVEEKDFKQAIQDVLKNIELYKAP